MRELKITSASLRLFAPKVEAVLALVGCCVALCFLLLFGIIGLFRDGHLGFDFVVFHNAGVQFLQGINPWLASIDSGAPFSYPPHLVSLVAFYGALPFELGLAIHTGVILFSIASVAYLANRWFLRIGDVRCMSLAQGIALALILGSPFVAHSVYEGQWSLPAVAVLFWSWHFLKQRRWLLAGLFLGLATIKPQVSLLYIFWLILNRQIRVLLVGAALAGLMLTPAFAQFGLLGTFTAWFESMAYYATQWANVPGSPHVVGVEGLLVSIGIAGSGWFLKGCALVALVLLYRYRCTITHTLMVQLFLVLALTFIYGHDTDYVTLSMLLGYTVILAFNQRSWAALGIAGILLFIMCFPQRFIRAFDIPVLFHTRTVALLIMCYFVWRWENNGSEQAKV